MFRDPIKKSVEFRLRPTADLRDPRDAHRFRRAVETRRTVGKLPEQARLQRSVHDPYADDKDSSLRDEWRAEEREWMADFREACRHE